ncbi:MAG: FkbM family methyltransferase [Gammaproteobacteria bacterium]|nr:MAG: FkbM family methyltransferase [Gammaproteobacteria bacterium]
MERPPLKRRFREGMRRLGREHLPPLLYRYPIALRNWRRGEPEIRLLPSLVRPGSVAVDVGAFLGAYTFFLRRLAGHVHAFEPQPACARFLRRAYPRRVTVHECALSDHAGRAALHGGEGPDQGARIGEENGRGRMVELKRLDDFALEEVGFIKIDAEGCESKVLKGADLTLRRWRPVLLVEIEQRHLEVPIAEVFREVRELGYRGSFLCLGERLPLDRFSLEAHQLARLQGDRSRPYINNFIFEPS